MRARSAHGDSLPLYNLLMDREGEADVGRASQCITQGLNRLRLGEDLSAVIVFGGEDGHAVDLEAQSDYGHAVLSEVQARSSLPPCPEGECQPSRTGGCMWCGR